jgi:hypothetical protein
LLDGAGVSHINLLNFLVPNIFAPGAASLPKMAELLTNVLGKTISVTTYPLHPAFRGAVSTPKLPPKGKEIAPGEGVGP